VTDYEILLMLDPELPDERQSEIVSRARAAIENDGGRFDGHEPWGRRRLSYEIDHKTDGSYHLLTFAAEATTLEEISRVLKITDGVMRHLAVRRVQGASTRPPEPTHEEPVAAAPPARQDAETAPETEPETESAPDNEESAPEAAPEPEAEPEAETTAESTA
jgi:small subunit ribosomal protein S6